MPNHMHIIYMHIIYMHIYMRMHLLHCLNLNLSHLGTAQQINNWPHNIYHPHQYAIFNLILHFSLWSQANQSDWLDSGSSHEPCCLSFPPLAARQVPYSISRLRSTVNGLLHGLHVVGIFVALILAEDPIFADPTMESLLVRTRLAPLQDSSESILLAC